jgi:hypothetical protein
MVVDIRPQSVELLGTPAGQAPILLEAQVAAEHVNLFWTPEIKVNVFFAPSRR